jgi:hypothetical protein
MKRKMFLPLLLTLISSAFQVAAQPVLPVVTVRFNNPVYDCPTKTYCVDVEFMSNTPGQQLFGINIRFYYDDKILEYIGTGDFAEGYAMPDPPVISNGDGGVLFGFSGPLEWFNGSVQLEGTTSVYLPENQWLKYFRICFHVDDPNSVRIPNFCPSIVWDLVQDPPPSGGGFQWGDDGVVITVVDPDPTQDSGPATEAVVQFNWAYDPTGNQFGFPASTNCISTICGYLIPLSNWSLFLAIGLMLAASVFIYRRRISG